jgi:hypothetical protein
MVVAVPAAAAGDPAARAAAVGAAVAEEGGEALRRRRRRVMAARGLLRYDWAGREPDAFSMILEEIVEALRDSDGPPPVAVDSDPGAADPE